MEQPKKKEKLFYLSFSENRSVFDIEQKLT